MKLEQEKQFIPTDDVLSSILKLYGLSFVSYKAATSGIENTTLIAQTSINKIVIRVYRRGRKSISDIDTEISFVLYLADNGVKVPNVLKNINGEYITNIGYHSHNWQVIAMKFIDGVHSEVYTPILITDMAKTQAKIHNLSSMYCPSNSNSGGLTELRERYFASQINRGLLINKELTNFLQRVEGYEVLLDPKLPKGLCHLDYDKDNIITKNNLIEAVLDFDDLELAPFIVCFSYTLCHIYMFGSEQMMKQYLTKYEELRHVSDLEKNYIKPIMLFRFYVISALKILNGHNSETETINYINMENKLIELEVYNG